MIVFSREGTTWLHYEDGACREDSIGTGYTDLGKLMTTLSWPGYTNLKIGDGNNESFLALFGPPDRDDKVSSIPVFQPDPDPETLQGIMYYKAIDLERGLFAKWKIAHELSARIAIGGHISIQLHPKNGKIALQNDQVVKVLHGTIYDGEDIRKPPGNLGFPTITPVISADCTVGDDGTIVLRLVNIDEKESRPRL
ncbi:hypothetical protein ACLX1H_006509 [Fusarium chlamydosporum]